MVMAMNIFEIGGEWAMDVKHHIWSDGEKMIHEWAMIHLSMRGEHEKLNKHREGEDRPNLESPNHHGIIIEDNT
jgi:hypothetical protein